LGQEEVVGADLARHRDAFQLCLLDDLYLILPCDMADMNRTIMERSWIKKNKVT